MHVGNGSNYKCKEGFVLSEDIGGPDAHAHDEITELG